MLTLYHAPQSRSSRMIWLLEELGCDYAIAQVDIFRAMTGTGAPDPANPHPDRQVPALDDDGVLITETVALAIYLGDKFPSDLAPAVGDPARGPYLAWLVWYAATMEPAMFAIFGGAPTPAQQKQIDNMHRRLATALDAGPWLMGDRFTLVDLIVGSAGQWARQTLPPGDKVDDWLRRVGERPALARATAKDGTP